MSDAPKNLGDELREVPTELRRMIEQFPDKALFGLLLLGWVALFHFLGNSTIGYVKTTSLFGWMKYVFTTSDGDELGLYMPLLILVLAYLKRAELMAVRKQPWWPALLLVVTGLLLHVAGYVVQQTRLSIIGFFVGLYGLFGLVWGWRLLSTLFFPFCLFAFCVPLATETERITFPMRLYATKITAFVCQTILGIGVINDGTMLYDPKGGYQYDIAAACSGIKSLTATVAIGLIGGFMFFRSPWRRLASFLAAFPLAVFGNVLRLTAIIVVSEAFDSQAGKFVHDNAILSLLPYVPAIGGLLLLVKVLQEKPSAAPSIELGFTPASDQLAGHLRTSIRRNWVMFPVLAALMIGTAGLLHHLQASQRLGEPGLVLSSSPLHDPQGIAVGTNSVHLPSAVGNYLGEEEPVARVMLDMLPKDTTYGQRRYKAPDGFWISSSVVLMGADRSSIHKPQICMVGQGWTILHTTPMKLRINQPHAYDLPVMKLDVSKEISNQDGKRIRVNGIFLYWFVSQNQLTADHWDRQLWMAKDLLQQGLLQRWAYVTYFAACLPGFEERTFERMKELIIPSVPQFQKVSGPPTSMASASAEGVGAGQ